MPDQEEWRPVPGYDGWYEVSDQGRVRSWLAPRHHAQPRRLLETAQILATSHINYTRVHLSNVTKLVHRLVAAAFIGPCPDGFEVCHNNGDSSDNRASNLRYDSRSNNHADKVIHGTMLRGEHVHGAKLTEQQVRDIRRKASEGVCQRVIGAEYGLQQAVISKIVNRHRWAWLQDEVAP